MGVTECSPEIKRKVVFREAYKGVSSVRHGIKLKWEGCHHAKIWGESFHIESKEDASQGNLVHAHNPSSWGLRVVSVSWPKKWDPVSKQDKGKGNRKTEKKEG